MSGSQSNQKGSVASNTATITSASSHNASHPRRRMAPSYLVIWVDANIDETNTDCQEILAQLRTVTNNVSVFTERDGCVDFLTDVKDMKAFLIVGDTIGQQIIPLIHDIPQLHGVYVFCLSEVSHEQWTKEWMKVKGVYTTITPICEALQVALKQCDQDSIAVSFVAVSEGASSPNLDELEPTFMYTQIFKEILLEIEFNEQSIHNFIQFLSQYYIGNTAKLNHISEFERDYSPHKSISWYTRESFIYEMLNRALRTLEADIIINMGFFIRDLHQQIGQLHQQQVSNYHGEPFTVYRGQGLLKTDFEKLLKTKGGLMSFNNFLSTSQKQDVSLLFAEGTLGNTDMVGILFIMSIDPSVSSSPFAAVKEVSHFQEEEEILFSMHTVFRIDEIKQIDNNSRLYQVHLRLTADDDEQLRILTKHIGEATAGDTGWERLGMLLLKIEKVDKAEELFKVLLEQTSDESEKAVYYHQLGQVKYTQGDYEKAICYYKKSLDIRRNTVPANHPDLATSYNNIALVYDKMGKYSKALSFYEKSRQIPQKTLPENPHDLAASYNNMGLVCVNMGEYSEALSFYEKSLEIFKTTLPVNHPDLASSYSNIAGVYYNMEKYSKALSFYEKSRQIPQKTLPENPHDLAASYNNMGLVCVNMGKYPKALSFYEKSLEIFETTLPVNHPDLASSYSNIAGVYYNMEKYSKALSFHEKSLEIRRKTLPENHPDLATSYNNIGLVYDKMREYSKALSFFKKSLEIRQKALSANHPDLAGSYNNVASVYDNMGEYSEALSFYEKSLEIFERTLSANHPDLATSYNNVASMYYNRREYSKALSYLERASNIWKIALPANHPNIKTVERNMELLKKKL
jgi:tetratricopeptide (TPR) repeat protein